MTPEFRPEKAVQAAAYLLQLAGGELSHLKLIKLMYLADREALLRHGRPITYDRWFSLLHGPILSNTLNRINGLPGPGREYWNDHISLKQPNHTVKLLHKCEPEDLSPAEQDFLREAYESFGRLGKWDLRNYTHSLPEWEDPHGSSVPIHFRDVLERSGLPDDEVQEILDELDSVAAAERILNA